MIIFGIPVPDIVPRDCGLLSLSVVLFININSLHRTIIMQLWQKFLTDVRMLYIIYCTSISLLLLDINIPQDVFLVNEQRAAIKTSKTSKET